MTAEIEGLVELCRERAAGYGALRKSSLTAIALDRAADALEVLARSPGVEGVAALERIARRCSPEEAQAWRDDTDRPDMALKMAAEAAHDMSAHARAALAALRGEAGG